jgi:hypothetical protein
MDFLQKLSIEELKNLIDRMPEESKSKAEARRRSNDVVRLHKDGLLNDLANFSGTVERIGKRYRSSATSARQTLGRVWTLVKYTYLRADKPVPLPDGVDKQAVESAVEAFWLWNRQERAKKTHREKGEFSVQEEKAVSDIQFREIMETVLQKYRDDVEPLYGNPNAESRIVIQRYLLLFYLLMEPNVRLTPLVNLKYFGNSLRDNIICFSVDGTVVTVFNRLKHESQAPIVNVLSQVTAPEFRRFFNTFRRGKEEEETGYFFTNADNERLTVNYCQKQINEILQNLFPNGKLTTRLLRILETTYSLEEKPQMTHSELEAFSKARAHCVEETLKYNRCRRKKGSVEESL